MVEQNRQDEAEVIEEEVLEEETEEASAKPVKDDKTPSIKKLLHQRNEAREKAKKVDEYEPIVKEVPQLRKEIQEMKELMAKNVLDVESKVEKTEFFTKNPKFTELETDIEKLRSEKGLSYEDAAYLVTAKQKPELLMDEQFMNKSQASKPLN